jgi:hypothetical protein
MASSINFAIVQALLLVIACYVASCAHSLKRMAPRPPAPNPTMSVGRSRWLALIVFTAIFAAIGILVAYFK